MGFYTLTEKQSQACLVDGQNFAAIIRKRRAGIESKLESEGFKFDAGLGCWIYRYYWAQFCEVTAQIWRDHVTVSANYGDGEVYSIDLESFAQLGCWQGLLNEKIERGEVD